MLLAGVLFGSTFEAMQGAVETAEPVPFLAVRFLFAAAMLAPFAARRPPSPGVTRAGLWCGAVLLVGYVAQTVGVQYTTTTASAFITYLLVVFVPLIAWVVLRKPPAASTTVGLAIALVGLVLLSGGGLALGRGEAFTLVCAIAFAVHVILLSEFAPRFDVVRLNTVQLGIVGAACVVPGWFLGGYDLTARAWLAALYTAAAASALAFFLQVAGQQHVGSSRTALLLMTEPVAAAAIGYAVGERLSATRLAGAALILAGIVVAEAASLVRPPVRPS